jgi:hypothetical protein
MVGHGLGKIILERKTTNAVPARADRACQNLTVLPVESPGKVRSRLKTIIRKSAAAVCRNDFPVTFIVLQ